MCPENVYGFNAYRQLENVTLHKPELRSEVHIDSKCFALDPN